MPDRPTFELGLVMAGAISAGAYTAGVLDFLLEALDAIEDVRAGRDTAYLRAGLRDEKPVFDPPHGFRLKALSGTSAGAMVTAILTTVLGTRVPPVGPKRRWTDTSPTGNPLYECWVQQIHWDRLLATDDLPRGAPVRSLLNSRHLERIVAGALAYAQRDDYRRPYIAPLLPIYLCVGNLRGVRYSLRLSVATGAVNEHQMSMHADWMGFCYDPDPSDGLAGLRSLTPGRGSDNWDMLGVAALASGAFPIGLAARTITRDFRDYEDRDWYDPTMPQPPIRREVNGIPIEPPDSPESWLSDFGGRRKIPPVDTEDDFPNGEYSFVNVDGGVFDNEPLELCRVAVAEGQGRNPRDPRRANRAVLLIDPFPNLFERDGGYDPEYQGQLLRVLKSLAGALISHARFKPDELALAQDDHVASRYAIMPIRYRTEVSATPEPHAIACGSLGGFGGFLSKAFRHHDFMLGRRNCQRFLARHFVLPADPEKGQVNPLFAGWTDPARRAEFRLYPTDMPGVAHLPIVPLLGKLASPDYTAMPPWPAWPDDLRIDALRSAITARADAVKDSLMVQYQPNFALRQGINSLWWLNKSKWVQRFAIAPMIADLAKRGLTG
jgi:hypothetical protein